MGPRVDTGGTRERTAPMRGIPTGNPITGDCPRAVLVLEGDGTRSGTARC